MISTAKDDFPANNGSSVIDSAPADNDNSPANINPPVSNSAPAENDSTALTPAGDG